MTKEEYERKVKSLVKQRDELDKVIKRLYKNLNTETGNVRSLESRIERLKEESIKSLTTFDDETSFTKFKISLRKLNISLENSKEVCELLETIVIPKKQEEFVEIKVRIDSFQRSYLLERKEADEKKIEELKRKIEAHNQKSKEQ